MTDRLATPCAAFEGSRLLAAGPLIEVALTVKNVAQDVAGAPVLVFDDATGRVIDLDLRGTKADIIARLSQPLANRAARKPAAIPKAAEQPPAEPRGRGRPKLGVVGREVTLLPRHWQWLAAQPGGASVALRKLVDRARREGGAAQQERQAREAAYHFMAAMAGNLPGFEEATRVLFAGDRQRFEHETAGWPLDVRRYATRLAFGRPGDMASGAEPG